MHHVSQRLLIHLRLFHVLFAVVHQSHFLNLRSEHLLHSEIDYLHHFQPLFLEF